MELIVEIHEINAFDISNSSVTRVREFGGFMHVSFKYLRKIKEDDISLMLLVSLGKVMKEKR
jgi:hypothetical protein